MRILHIGKFYPPDRGGMETFLRDLAEAQVDAGHEVVVMANADRAPAGRTTARPGLEIIRARVVSTLGGYAPVAPAAPAILLRELWRFKPDIVHVHAPNSAAFWPLLLRVGAGLVVHWHADVQFPAGRQPSAVLLSLWALLERWLLGRAGAVIATSPAYLASSIPLVKFRQKCHVVPLGLTERAPEGVAGDDVKGRAASEFLRSAKGLRVLSVGRLSHYKGFEVLCQAAALVPGITVCFVGEGEERQRLEQIISRLGLGGRVLLAGALSDASLDECYRSCDVFCLPSLSRSEAFGMVLLEAMMRGKPCVASAVDGGGPSSVVEHEKTGLLVAPANPRALADGLRRMQERDELRARMGSVGRQRFYSHFSIGKVVERIDEVYRAVRNGAQSQYLGEVRGSGL